MRFHKSFWIFISLITLAVAAWVINFALFPDSRKSVSTSVPDQPDKIIKKTASAQQLEKQKHISAQDKELLPDMPIPVGRLQKKRSKKKVSRKAATSVRRTRPLKSTQPSLPPKILDSKPVSVKPLEDSKLKLQAKANRLRDFASYRLVRMMLSSAPAKMSGNWYSVSNNHLVAEMSHPASRV
jgi:hypothetical protein